MKPAWDSLMREYEGHPSVLIGDVDCTQHQDLCSDMGVGGYPTIKYWTDGAGKEDAKPYQGGRDLDALRKHVEDNMLPKCDAKDPEGSGCDDQEIAYVAKMIAKGGEAVEKELARLEGMQGSAMKADKKAWLAKRVHILKGLAAQAPALSDFRPDAGADDGARPCPHAWARGPTESARRGPGGVPILVCAGHVASK